MIAFVTCSPFIHVKACHDVKLVKILYKSRKCLSYHGNDIVYFIEFENKDAVYIVMNKIQNTKKKETDFCIIFSFKFHTMTR